MVRTRVGYAGGKKENPTYYSLGDHTETIQIDFDPTLISYEGLLEVFWESHSPTGPAWSRQYMSAVFCHDAVQERQALELKNRVAARSDKVFTEILPAERFYLAEDYHQKYRLRQSPRLVKEFSAIYPRLEDFVNSTAVARVNGYLGGYGKGLAAEMDDLGLTEEGRKELARQVTAEQTSR